jgi:hypothetical protein
MGDNLPPVPPMPGPQPAPALDPNLGEVLEEVFEEAGMTAIEYIASQQVNSV